MSAAEPPVGSSVPGNTPISDEAMEAFYSAQHGWLRENADAATQHGPSMIPDESFRAGLAAAAPLLVSAEAERLRRQLADALGMGRERWGELLARAEYLGESDEAWDAAEARSTIEGLRAELAEKNEIIDRIYQRNLLRAIEASRGCTCLPPLPETYDGPQPVCAMHPADLALAHEEIDRLHVELASEKRRGIDWMREAERAFAALAALRAAGGQENDEPKFTVGPDGSVYAAQAGLTLAELGDPSKVAQHVAKRVGIQLPAPVGGQAEPSDDEDPDAELLSVSGNHSDSTAKCQLCDEPHVGYIFGGPDKIGHYCRVHLVLQTRHWAGIWAANGAAEIAAAAVSGEQATPPSEEQR